jgi:hypothetical protein
MTTELNNVVPAQTECDVEDPEYDAYVSHEVKGFAKTLSDFYVFAERFDANLSAILWVLRQSPKFQEEFFKEFNPPGVGDHDTIGDARRGYLLTQTLNGVLHGFAELADQYDPYLKTPAATDGLFG